MRKKILILVAVIGLGITANAQDIILKQDGSEITVKVLEITDQQVKYKDFDFQSGPTRNLNISEIFMITYENGQREVFNKQTFTPTQPRKPADTLKNEFYEIGTNDIEMLKFFRKNNFKKYYNDFESACRMRNTGIGLLVTGAAFSCLGVACMTVGLIEGYFGTATAGYIFLGVGEILTIVSIPVSAVAGGRKRSIKNDFAREYFSNNSYTFQPTLNLNCTGNGLGISLKF